MSNERHGNTRNGISTPTYISWNSMKQRCHYPKHKKYNFYGGIGICVCDRWRYSFTAFLSDMGERPEGTSLDRINPAGNYEPGNCRWLPTKDQASNCKNTVKIEFEGRLFLVGELSLLLNVPKYNLYKWIKKNHDLREMSVRFHSGIDLHSWHKRT